MDFKQSILASLFIVPLIVGCAGNKGTSADSAQGDPQEVATRAEVPFDADSAYLYVKTQVDFGPRVPNTEAHRAASRWMAGELGRHGAKVTLQQADIRAFDGTLLKACNVFGQFNPEAADRTLLVAHYDSRPWADSDPDELKRTQPVDGANDGASGVGVLLEIARQFGASGAPKGVDILLVDAEDWGNHDDDDSWALGTQHFVANPVVPGYRPDRVILLDMVGGRNAVFNREYFSQRYAASLVDKVWAAAAEAGYADRFPNRMGGAITDDHVKFIEADIPAIDIIEFSNGGFNPVWHTSSDTMANIDKSSLEAVGKTVMQYLLSN